MITLELWNNSQEGFYLRDLSTRAWWRSVVGSFRAITMTALFPWRESQRREKKRITRPQSLKGLVGVRAWCRTCTRPVVTQEEGTNGYLLRLDTSYPRSHLSPGLQTNTPRATTRDVRFGIFIFTLSRRDNKALSVPWFLDEECGATNSWCECKNAAGISASDLRIWMNRRLIRNALDTVT